MGQDATIQLPFMAMETFLLPFSGEASCFVSIPLIECVIFNPFQ
jgi:hypothetical protein